MKLLSATLRSEPLQRHSTSNHASNIVLFLGYKSGFLCCGLVVSVMYLLLLCLSDAYVVTLTCYNDQHKTSPSSTTLTVHVDSSFSFSSRSRSDGCASERESRFVVAENMNNVTLGRLRCPGTVFCRPHTSQCSLTVRGMNDCTGCGQKIK